MAWAVKYESDHVQVLMCSQMVSVFFSRMGVWHTQVSHGYSGFTAVSTPDAFFNGFYCMFSYLNDELDIFSVPHPPPQDLLSILLYSVFCPGSLISMDYINRSHSGKSIFSNWMSSSTFRILSLVLREGDGEICYTESIHKINELWEVITDCVNCITTGSIPIFSQCLNNMYDYHHMFHSENRAEAFSFSSE